MKTKTLKKLLAVTCSAMLAFSMIGCGSSSEESSSDVSASKTETEADYKIAIVKQLDHASLEEIANAIAAQLDAISEEKGIHIEYEIYSGQNDQSTLKQIGEQAIADGVDAIIPIATLAAQVMAVCAEDTKTPVVYAAISDPEAADMIDIDYVTGTCDALNTGLVLDMMLAQNPDLEKVGLLYSPSETNSERPIAEMKSALDDKGISYTEQTANTNDEVVQAASSLIAEGVDAIFTPTDNVIMAAELAIYEDLADAGIPHYTGADSFVRNGAFAASGVNYTDLGTETADLAYTVLTEGMAELFDYYYVDSGIITINSETAKTLGIDCSIFTDIWDIVEVTTTEE